MELMPLKKSGSITGLNSTVLEEPRAGHPRYFSKAAVYEAALIAAISRQGVRLELATQWVADIVKRILKGDEKDFVYIVAWVYGSEDPVFIKDPRKVRLDQMSGLLGAGTIVMVDIPFVIERIDQLLAEETEKTKSDN